MNRFEIEKITWLKFKTSGKLLIISEESMEQTSNNSRKTKTSQPGTGWTWKH
jgi:hypothetical protein